MVAVVDGAAPHGIRIEGVASIAAAEAGPRPGKRTCLRASAVERLAVVDDGAVESVEGKIVAGGTRADALCGAGVRAALGAAAVIGRAVVDSSAVAGVVASGDAGIAIRTTAIVCDTDICCEPLAFRYVFA